MFQSWTQIDLHALAGSNINSPANGIYMSNEEHQLFRQFEFYLDKDAVGSLSWLIYHLEANVRISIQLSPTSTGCEQFAQVSY